MNRIRPMLLALAAAVLMVPSAFAQQPGAGQIPPEIRARMKAWEKWRASHKNIQSLQQTIGGLEAMEKEPRTRLTKAQAKTVVGILKAWRNKPVMTDAQALKVNKQITAPLTVAQLKKIATAREGRGMSGNRRPGGGGAGMQGGRGGAQGAQGARPGGGQPRRMDANRFPAPKEYNPLNPNTIPMERMRARAKQRLDTLTNTLAARAK